MLLLLILHCFKSLTDLIYLFRSTDISGRKKKNPSFWSSFLLNLNYGVTDKEKPKAQRHIYSTEIH